MGTGTTIAPSPPVPSDDLFLSPTFVHTLVADSESELTVDKVFGPIMRDAAAALGWRVLRFSTQQVEKHPQECVELTLCALDNNGLLPGWMEKPPGRRR